MTDKLFAIIAAIVFVCAVIAISVWVTLQRRKRMQTYYKKDKNRPMKKTDFLIMMSIIVPIEFLIVLAILIAIIGNLPLSAILSIVVTTITAIFFMKDYKKRAKNALQ